MSPIQQMLLGAGGAVATKTYVDDVFSTYVYTGDGSARSINNGIDLAGEGGLVWSKVRDLSYGHFLFNTVNGNGNYLRSDTSDAQATYSTSGTNAGITAFNNNGYSLGADQSFQCLNYGNNDYSSWTFRKAPGFFDVVTYSGSGSYKTVAHSLGCVPGMYMIKRTDTGSSDWRVFHRGLFGPGYRLVLNTNEIQNDLYSLNQNTGPTSSVFSVGSDSTVNDSSGTYVCYLFAGGESTAATARSVDFDGSGDYLVTNNSSDYDLGTGDFTCELWFYHSDDSNDDIVDRRTANASVEWDLNVNNNQIVFIQGTQDKIVSRSMPKDVWYHLAIVRHSGTTTMYIDGNSEGSFSDTNDYDNTEMLIGTYMNPPSYELKGGMSNLRLVKGTAVYTSAFKVPTEPLTNISGTVLLCCNNSSVTGTTVGTVTSGGNPTASTDSPFDDPAGFVFGESESENVIKCGSYEGSGAAENQVYVGFEPSFVMVKCISNAGNWRMFDSMRGIVSGGNDTHLQANTNGAENVNFDQIDLTPTGFKLQSNGNNTNGGGFSYVYVAIRRSDGYVGKPASAGTDVFAMDGSPTNNFPAWNSGFPVDFAIDKKAAESGSWEVTSRFMVNNAYLVADTTAVDATYGTTDTGLWRKDSNTGFGAASMWGGASVYQAWMWKRHAGLDLAATKGGAYKKIAHSLGKSPEMYWVKNRSNAADWTVYHKGLNGGSNPENYYIILNSNSAQSSSSSQNWGSFVPTSTHISFGNSDAVGSNSSYNYMVMLFASVDGISKVGSYSGSGSTGNAQNIGFQPRFLFIKRTNSTGDWMQFNSVGGFGNYMQLNTTQQQNSQTYVSVSSTGFSLVSDYGDTNESGSSYIYYAHA